MTWALYAIRTIVVVTIVVVTWHVWQSLSLGVLEKAIVTLAMLKATVDLLVEWRVVRRPGHPR